MGGRHSLGVQLSHDGEGDDTQGHNGDVVACAHQSREQHGIGCWPEHVPVDLLPAVLVTKVLLLVAHHSQTQTMTVTLKTCCML